MVVIAADADKSLSPLRKEDFENDKAQKKIDQTNKKYKILKTKMQNYKKI